MLYEFKLGYYAVKATKNIHWVKGDGAEDLSSEDILPMV